MIVIKNLEDTDKLSFTNPRPIMQQKQTDEWAV